MPDVTSTVKPAAVTRSNGSTDPLMKSLRAVEEALFAPGGTPTWAAGVRDRLMELIRLLQHHDRATERPGGVFAEIDRLRPDLQPRTRQLRRRHVRLVEKADALAADVERCASGATAAFPRIRREAAELITEMKLHQAEETDLVLETYERDTGTAD
jgi:hypothetical protein